MMKIKLKFKNHINPQAYILFLESKKLRNIRLKNMEITFDGKGAWEDLLYGQIDPYSSISKGQITFLNDREVVILLNLTRFKLIIVFMSIFASFLFLKSYDNSLGLLPIFITLLILWGLCFLIIYTRERKLKHEFATLGDSLNNVSIG